MDMSGPGTSVRYSGAQRDDPGMSRLHSASADQTRRLGMTLGALLAPGDVVLLEGELGAGKTALTQGIGAGMGVHGVINSPTFTILKEYMGRIPLYHFDLYRIESPDEVYTLGFDDYFAGEGACVVEWAERGEPGTDAPWPESYLRVRLRADGAAGSESRQIEVTGAGPRGAELQAAWTRAAAEES